MEKAHGPMPGRGRRDGGKPGGKPKNTKTTILRIWQYISQYKIRLCGAMLFMLLNAFSHIAGSYMLRPIINDYIAVGKLEGFVYILMVLASVYAVGVVSAYCQHRIMLSVSQGTIENIRKDLFHKVQTLPVRFFDTENTGEIMSRFTNDVDNIGVMLDSSVMTAISGIITLIGTFAMMLYTNVFLSVITVLFIPVFLKVGAIIANKSRKYYGQQQAALGALNGYIEESVSGQKVVKVFCHEKECVEEFGLLNEDLKDKQFFAQFFGGVMGPILGNISQISYALTAGVGGVLCALGRFDIGGLTVFVNYSRQFSRPINEISMQMHSVFLRWQGQNVCLTLWTENRNRKISRTVFIRKPFVAMWC